MFHNRNVKSVPLERNFNERSQAQIHRADWRVDRFVQYVLILLFTARVFANTQTAYWKQTVYWDDIQTQLQRRRSKLNLWCLRETFTHDCVCGGVQVQENQRRKTASPFGKSPCRSNNNPSSSAGFSPIYSLFSTRSTVRSFDFTKDLTQTIFCWGQENMCKVLMSTCSVTVSVAIKGNPTLTSSIGLWNTIWKLWIWHYGCHHLGFVVPQVTFFGWDGGAGEDTCATPVSGLDLTEDPKTQLATSQ